GGAHGLDVELREAGAGGGEGVEVGGLDVRGAVEADVLPAEVVGDDVDDIGRARLRRGGARHADEGEREQETGEDRVNTMPHDLPFWKQITDGATDVRDGRMVRERGVQSQEDDPRSGPVEISDVGAGKVQKQRREL